MSGVEIIFSVSILPLNPVNLSPARGANSLSHLKGLTLPRDCWVIYDLRKKTELFPPPGVLNGGSAIAKG